MNILHRVSWALIFACVFTAGVAAFNKHRFLSSTLEAPAEIVAFQKSPDPDDDYATPVLEFDYQNKRIHIENPFMVNNAMFKIKQIVPVIFNPENPQQAQMKTAAFQYYPSAILLVCALLLWIIHMIVFRKDSK